MIPQILVIDDFHDNPDIVRNVAVNAEYPEPESTYTYPGKNSRDNYYPKELHAKFEYILKQKLEPAPNNGYFRLSLEKDSFQQDIHVDPTWQYGAVCYMNSPEQCIDEAGTSFWIHNKTNTQFLPHSQEASSIIGFPNPKEFWWTTVYGEGLDRSKWTRYFLSGMKYNRIVIFNANMFHSHNYNFGNCLENGRIVQLFFFNPTGWQ